MSIQFKRRAPNSGSAQGKNVRPKIQTDHEDHEDDEATVQIIKPEIRHIGSNTILSASTISGDKNKKNADEMTNNRGGGGAVTQIYYSTKEIVPQKFAGDATHTSEVDTDISKDARAILERNILLNETGVLEDEPNIYRGQAGYKNFTKKDMSMVGSNKYTGTHGPIRAPAFVRSTARFDYQPDICKDYKETGFCGYGDQCKFLHDRGDYKSGWQLEKEWDVEQAKKRQRMEDSLKSFARNEGGIGGENDDNNDNKVGEEDEVDYSIDFDESLPFACFICRQDFRNPIVTLCGHFFCQECALQSTKKDTRCPICHKQTSGVFNKAHKLIKQLALTKLQSGAGAGSEELETHQQGEEVNKVHKGSWEIVE